MQGTNALPLGVAVEIEAIVQVLHFAIAAFHGLIRLGPNSLFCRTVQRLREHRPGHEHICKQGSQLVWPTMLAKTCEGTERNNLTLSIQPSELGNPNPNLTFKDICYSLRIFKESATTVVVI